MKLVLTEDDGTVLDSTDVTADEWKHARRHSQAALQIITELAAGEGAT